MSLITIAPAYLKAMEASSKAFAIECVKSVAKLNDIDEEEALTMVGLYEAPSPVKSVTSTADKREELQSTVKDLLQKLKFEDEVPTKIGELTKFITQLKRQVKVQTKEDKVSAVKAVAEEKRIVKDKKIRDQLAAAREKAVKQEKDYEYKQKLQEIEEGKSEIDLESSDEEEEE